MQRKRIKDLESRLEQMETALLQAFSLISQLDLIQYSVGEVLLEKKVIEKQEVDGKINVEIAKRRKEQQEANMQPIPREKPKEHQPIPAPQA